MRSGRNAAPNGEGDNPTKKPTLSNKIVGSLCLFTGVFLIACLLVLLIVSPKEERSKVFNNSSALFFGLLVASLFSAGIGFWRGQH